MSEETEDLEWFRTDQHRELLEVATFVGEFCGRLDERGAWRWVILGSTLALQGALVCSLSGHDTSGTNILKADLRAPMLQWLSKRTGRYPSDDIAGPATLLRRACDAQELLPPHTLVIDSKETKDIERLITFRHQFIHFADTSWSLEVAGLPRMVDTCWGAIEHLACKQPTFLHRVMPGWSERVLQAATLVRSAMAHEA